MTRAVVRLGTAGWSLPRAQAHAFPGDGAHLCRYARVLKAAEINSTFHKPHRASTYARWAESVPDDFRFSVKIPKTITHTARLLETDGLIDAFLEELAPLRHKVACLLVQLPPSLVFDAAVAERFFGALRTRHTQDIACEPRHASWLTAAADTLLSSHRVARVAADPAAPPGAESPGGWSDLRYFRWHGSPRRYYSSYPDETLAALAGTLRKAAAQSRVVWCIFDNTVTGAAAENALAVRRHLDT